jgi:GNAT superfamily N-acetyltransferase
VQARNCQPIFLEPVLADLLKFSGDSAKRGGTMAVMDSLSVQEYVDLRASVGWASPSPDLVARGLAESVGIATSRRTDGVLVGLARAVGDGIYVCIVDVIVDPGAQGQGIGAALVRTLLDQDRVKRAAHVALFAAPGVVGFYEQLGFTQQEGSYLRH